MKRKPHYQALEDANERAGEMVKDAVKAIKESHKTKKIKRTYVDVLCAEPTCEFRGKHAQQGVCHTTESELIDWDKLECRERELEAELAAAHTKYGTTEYLKWLEVMYSSVSLNWESTIDECIHLRLENARLKLKLKRGGKP